MRPATIRIIIESIGSLAFLLLPLIVVPALAPVAAAPPIRPVLWSTVLIHMLIIAYYFLISYYGLPRLYFRGKRGPYLALTVASLAAVLDRHAAASWAAKRAFDRYPRTVFAAARAPGVFNVVAGLLCGDVAHPADARGVARGPLKLIARLAG